MTAGMQVDINVFGDDKTDYAILSHRWNDTEVNYKEIVDLAKMEGQKRDDIRERAGYKKILDTCRQAQKDGYEWVWVDTCCIDKRSSAELSEAINSMYRWYANAKACYAHLHDVDGSSFPTEKDDEKYQEWNGWPEWFSRGWTLQEMIAPSDVQFFNENWQPIGTKKTLAETLATITQVPEHILVDGLDGNRPCVAQIMSWAANRSTTRVEDRAYSLMGLLDVKMPMLYGEEKKAFHRLQLEIIRSSDDQSIFAWGWNSPRVEIGSILADNPSCFKGCSNMKLIDNGDFIGRAIEAFPKLRSVDANKLGVFANTNRGIQIWMLLCAYRESKSVFRAYLPCLCRGFLVSIDLVLWNSNYYRYSNVWQTADSNSAEFRQVYLRYHDTPNYTVAFDIDDSGITENGFTCSNEVPAEHAGNTFTLTNANPVCVKTYSEQQGSSRFKVVFGQCLGLDWVHLDYDFSLGTASQIESEASIAQGPDWALALSDTPLRNHLCDYLWIRHFRLPGSSWVVRAYRMAWERSKVRVRMEVFRDPQFRSDLDEWKAYPVEVSDFIVYMDYYTTCSFVESR